MQRHPIKLLQNNELGSEDCKRTSMYAQENVGLLLPLRLQTMFNALQACIAAHAYSWTKTGEGPPGVTRSPSTVSKAEVLATETADSPALHLEEVKYQLNPLF